MSNQVTLGASFFAKLDAADERVEEEAKGFLTDVATTAVSLSPVDTGAYVTSFSILPAGSGGGRSRTSKGKPRGINPALAKSTAMEQLMGDIARLDFETSPKFILRNRSPHSRAVEDGGWNWRRSGHGVFRMIRRMFR